MKKTLLHSVTLFCLTIALFSCKKNENASNVVFSGYFSGINKYEFKLSFLGLKCLLTKMKLSYGGNGFQSGFSSFQPLQYHESRVKLNVSTILSLKSCKITL